MPARTAKKRTSTTRPPAKPVISIGIDEEIDWTPDKNKLYPRTVTVRQGKLQVNIEEAGEPTEKRFIFIVGAGDGRESVRDNLLGEEFKPDDLDLFISLLTLARDKARELGMPSDRRDGAAV